MMTVVPGQEADVSNQQQELRNRHRIPRLNIGKIIDQRSIETAVILVTSILDASKMDIRISKQELPVANDDADISRPSDEGIKSPMTVTMSVARRLCL